MRRLYLPKRLCLVSLLWISFCQVVNADSDDVTTGGAASSIMNALAVQAEASPASISQSSTSDSDEPAEDESAEDESTEDNNLRIVVTAEKTPEAVQDVPISLTVLTQE